MTSCGLSTTDIDVNSEELSFFVRVRGLLDELNALGAKCSGASS